MRPAPATHVQDVPASVVVANRRHEALPQSDRPRTHPTFGEMNVTDSGCSATELSPTVESVGDGVAVGATVGVAVLEDTGLIDGVGDGVVGCELHPASRRTASTPVRRIERVMTGERSFLRVCSGLR